ncbi:DUF962 domain-containing protein [Rheinheimera riviphila]|uniref:DUF962 domain-containing protein n=1 Tax=Rheinheimera riviphila TaxID=1834037 RepID=A0A437R151_9GAMM|nr:DUF962 domain-containing protein [Rheinheimera riviphila]RVU40467.1 DUF962 domain-containing protein [Rheinheimera riviphila]
MTSSPVTDNRQKFTTFAEFYPYYLSEHQLPACRLLHYLGSSLVLALLGFMLWSGQWQWWWTLLVAGYGCAWIGHFFIEHNRPATFKYPFFSLAADWVMFKDMLTGQLAAKLAKIPASSAP